ncbi:MAG TPA: nitroreductase family protein [Tepidisphaeraceae bacterium]|jgi:SagB-type dehydrogenase family enzyme
MSLPDDILDCSERLLDFHRRSRLEPSSPAAGGIKLPSTRLFSAHPRTPLSTRILDLPVPVLPLLESGLDAVPESLHRPRGDIQALSTWLYLAGGCRGRGAAATRAWASCDDAYSVEIYVAAFAFAGLEPGLYHYGVAEHALRRLRDGPTALALLRRGRPDLNFLGQAPGAVLVSTLFCRSSHLHGIRALRNATVDAGAAVANLHATAGGLGISTVTRLRLNDAHTRCLIGLDESAPYEEFETVQAIVAWGENADVPHDLTGPADDVLPLIRPALPPTPAYGDVVAAYGDCTVRGVGVRELRPPLTDLSPLPADVGHADASSTAVPDSRSLRSVLLDGPRPPLQGKPIARAALMAISRAGFRSGTFAPLRPDGPHLAVVRPFWVILNVSNVDPGIWWHDPIHDRWAHLNHGVYPRELVLLARGREECAEAAAVCVMVANLTKLLGEGGPDLYRLAHLESGLAGQRMRLAADAINATAVSFGNFNDALCKQFLGIGHTGWEPLLLTAVGGRPVTQGSPETAPRDLATLEFRD